MNIPGFTAEASLYSRRGVHYVAEGGVPMTELGPQAVFLSQAAGGETAAQRISQGWGGWQCWYWRSCMICCGPWGCWYLCYNNASQSLV
jgi:hypothetical protein